MQIVYILSVVRAILIFLLIYVAYVVIRLFQSIGKTFHPPERSAKSVQGKMVKDENCNTYIPQEEALREVRDGKEYYFCSQECRKAFLDKK